MPESDETRAARAPSEAAPPGAGPEGGRSLATAGASGGRRSRARPRRIDDWPALLDAAHVASGGAELARLARVGRHLERERGLPGGLVSARVSLLGGHTLDLVVEPLWLALLGRGIEADVRIAGYDQIVPELLDPASETSRFAPQVALVLWGPANVVHWPAPGATAAEAQRVAERGARGILDACTRLHERCGTEIVIDNLRPEPWDVLGGLAARDPASRTNFLRRLNLALGDLAPDHVHLHDVAGIVERQGLERFLDLRLWYHARQPIAFDCLPDYVHGLASVVGALFGRARKCLVTDLDGTLWCGVVGDDGVAGLELGEGSAVGEAHKALQVYLRGLRERGVVLAVCSKNDREAAEAPFREHPEMVLRLDDFAAFRASWEPKSAGLAALARELDLGLDSFVFLDDNPAERLEVRRALPDVAVPELPDDPAFFVPALARGRFFEAIRVTAEDRGRTELYRGRREAAELQEAAGGDYDAYLRELAMRAVVRPFEEVSLDRITQLVNKTNQFNLTTRRMSRAEVVGAMEDPGRVTRTVRLADRFADQGLISVAIGRVEGDALEIETWVMSCRVLKRRVEELLLDELVTAARERGLRELRGSHLPTERNGLVRDLYPELGFEPLPEPDGAPAGATRWRLAVADHRPPELPIERVDEPR